MFQSKTILSALSVTLALGTVPVAQAFDTKPGSGPITIASLCGALFTQSPAARTCAIESQRTPIGTRCRMRVSCTYEATSTRTGETTTQTVRSRIKIPLRHVRRLVNCQGKPRVRCPKG